MTEKLNLHQKLVKVYAIVDHVEKKGRNDRQKYDFVRAADVLRALRNAFSELGIYAQTNVDLLGTYDIKTNSGGVMHAATVKVTITLHDADSAETIAISGIGDGADGGDKGVYKAQTGAVKNCLRNGFLLPDEADPEADQSVDDAVAEPEPEPLPRRRVSQAPAEDRGSRPENGFRERTRVPAAKIPDVVPTFENPLGVPQDLPLSEVTSDMTEEVDKGFIQTQPEMPAPAGAVASNTELAEFGKRLRALADDLGGKGGLKASRGLPVNRKVLAYLFKVTGMTDATKITLVQWNAFFQFADKIVALPDGYAKLAVLVNGGKA